MFYTDYLPGDYPFFFRFGLLIALVLLVYRCTSKGVQNGVLIGLITGATSIILFSGREIMPGLPNNISLDRIVWPVVLAVFLIKRSRGETQRLSFDWIERGLLAFITVMLTSMIGHGSYVDADGEWSLFFILHGYGLPFIAYFIIRRAAGTPKHFDAFVVGLGYFTLYLAFTGLAEIFNIHALIFPQFIINPQEGIHFGKVRGPFLNASKYGLALAMSLPVLAWLYFNDRKPHRHLWLMVAALSTPCLLFTFQRAAWVSAAIAAAVVAVTWPRRRVFLTWCLLFVVICGFWLASDNVIRSVQSRVGDQNTIDSRLLTIEKGLVLFRTSPILGVGINRYRSEIEQRWRRVRLKSSAHNTWVTLLAELGLLGVAIYLLPLIFVLVGSCYRYLCFPHQRPLLGVLIAITLAYLAMTFSIESRSNLYANGLLLSLWAMILARLRRQYPMVADADRVEPNTSRNSLLQPAL